MARWKYVFIIVVLVSRVTDLLLTYVSDISDWCWYLFTGCWFALFFVAIWALFRFKWFELAIISATLAITAAPAFRAGEVSIARLQEDAFRLYALHRIRSVPLDEFLSNCNLVDYVENDGSKGKVGECYGFHSTIWFRPSVIYDPTGQFALPATRRTQAWKSTVEWDLTAGVFLAESDHDDSHIYRDFYFVLIPHEAEDG